MDIAGISVADRDVELLAGLLASAGLDDVSTKLAWGLEAAESELHALTVDDCEAILRVLEDPPDGLDELRDVLERART